MSLRVLTQVKTTLDTALENIAGQLSNPDPRICSEKNLIFPFFVASLVTFGCMVTGALFVKYFKRVKNIFYLSLTITCLNSN